MWAQDVSCSQKRPFPKSQAEAAATGAGEALFCGLHFGRHWKPVMTLTPAHPARPELDVEGLWVPPRAGGARVCPCTLRMRAALNSSVLAPWNLLNALLGVEKTSLSVTAKPNHVALVPVHLLGWDWEEKLVPRRSHCSRG